MEGTLLTSHAPEKVTTYLDFIKMFAELINNPGSKKETKRLGTKMITVGLSILALAPDPVAKAFIFWKALSAEGGDPEVLVGAFGDVILEMRKDLVGETICSRGDIIGVFLRDQV